LNVSSNDSSKEEIMTSSRHWLGVAGLAGALALAAGSAVAQDKEIVLGLQCDRTGATQIVGTTLCPAYHDYVALVNSKGGIEGYKVKVIEIDHEYKVPPAMEAHERFKKEGAILEAIYGTPQTAALNKKLEEDKLLGTSPGFGTAAAADGKKYPYTFPIAASYWSQSAAAVKFAKDKLGGSLKGKKIAYLYYDNPAGKEPFAVLEDLSASEGFELKTFAVPAPGVEMAAQVLDITARFRPDFVITHLFGRSPSVSIKELKGKGYPLSKVIAMVWGSAEGDIVAAGGWGVAEGYNTMQFAGVGHDYQVIKDINEMYKAQGKQPPKEQENSVNYNRGVFQAAVHLEAIRNAIKAKGGAKPTGEDVKKGMEQIKDFTLGGLVPPLNITAEDHEGGGWVQIWTVKGGKFEKATDWFQAYRDVVKKHLATN
jgi:branched-chain amino acid transport system substrate-binding protein